METKTKTEISNTKFTKGKWVVKVNELTPDKEIFVAIENRGGLARIFHSNELVNTRETALENAKLMAAAPDLLEALIGARELLRKLTAAANISFIENEDVQFKAIRKAIDKATK